MSITNSKKYQRLGDKDGNPLNGGKTLTHGALLQIVGGDKLIIPFC
ncbi:hypothetical protein [Proteus mirabilis]